MTVILLVLRPGQVQLCRKEESLVSVLVIDVIDDVDVIGDVNDNIVVTVIYLNDSDM